MHDSDYIILHWKNAETPDPRLLQGRGGRTWKDK